MIDHLDQPPAIMLQAYHVHFEIQGLREAQCLTATGNTIDAAVAAAKLDARNKWPERTRRVCAIIPVQNP